MTQFAVFRNPGRGRDIAYLVQIQTTRLDRARDRVVMALATVGPGAPSDHALSPHFIVQGQTVYADPLNIATLPRRILGPELEVLGDAAQDRIIRAIDEMISRG